MYTKFVRRGRKLCGPYAYSSKRIGNSVRSIYLGRASMHSVARSKLMSEGRAMVSTPDGKVYLGENIEQSHMDVIRANKLATSGDAYDEQLRSYYSPKQERIILEGPIRELVTRDLFRKQMKAHLDKYRQEGLPMDTPIRDVEGVDVGSLNRPELVFRGEYHSIVRRGKKWVVMDKDKTRVLGIHPSYKKALKQLQAIEISKRMRHSIKSDFKKAKRITEMPDDDRYVVQQKLDGMRVKIFNDNGFRIINRIGKDVTRKFPELRYLEKQLPKGTVVDGELVVRDTKGESLKLLQEHNSPVTMEAFDILKYKGKALDKKPFTLRERFLKRIKESKNLKIVKTYPASEAKRLMKLKNAEGVVFKRKDSVYDDSRDSAWLKLKQSNDADVVITGYEPGKGKRKGAVGALHIGIWDAKSKSIKSVGKVGTGFSDKEAKELKAALDKIKLGKNEGIIQVRPNLFAKVGYLRRGSRGALREPVYKGVRMDMGLKDTHASLTSKDIAEFSRKIDESKLFLQERDKDVPPWRKLKPSVKEEEHWPHSAKPHKTTPEELLAKRVEGKLKPFVKRIQVAGSIRRGEAKHKDIDIVAIPKDKDKIRAQLKALGGKKVVDGDEKLSYKINGTNVEVYFAKPEDWGGMLTYATGSRGHTIGFRKKAKELGYRMDQHGVWKGKKLIAGKTEEDIWKVLERPRFKQPWERYSRKPRPTREMIEARINTRITRLNNVNNRIEGFTAKGLDVPEDLTRLQKRLGQSIRDRQINLGLRGGRRSFPISIPYSGDATTITVPGVVDYKPVDSGFVRKSMEKGYRRRGQAFSYVIDAERPNPVPWLGREKFKYVGSTTEPERRMESHRLGKGALSLRGKGVYISNIDVLEHPTLQGAIDRESKLKVDLRKEGYRFSTRPQAIGSKWAGDKYIHGPRRRQPNEFKTMITVDATDKRFKSLNKSKLPKGARLVVGKLKKTGKWALQSVLTPRKGSIKHSAKLKITDSIERLNTNLERLQRYRTSAEKRGKTELLPKVDAKISEQEKMRDTLSLAIKSEQLGSLPKTIRGHEMEDEANQILFKKMDVERNKQLE